jgi:phthiocerol/phenolphthiocerol synthesis type-I polyketide synthase D
MTTASSSAPKADIDGETLTSWLTEKISEVLGVDPGEIDVHTPLTDYGMDSRQFIDLKFDLEDLLGHEFATVLVWENPTIAQLVETLMSAQPVNSDTSQLSE